MVVGCKCGQSKVVSREPDYDYEHYYVIIECEECGYYWEGYMGICLSAAYEYEDGYEDEEFVSPKNRLPSDPFITKYGHDFLMFRHYRVFNCGDWRIVKRLSFEKRMVLPCSSVTSIWRVIKSLLGRLRGIRGISASKCSLS
jgi:hypothetical protein